MKNKIVDDIINKTLQELNTPPSAPRQRSRIWESGNAYRYLVQWSNAVLLRYLIRFFTSSLPKSEYRRKAQLDDAARSVVRNIEEGFKRATTSEYLDFVGYSQGSLEEVRGDIRELTEDGFLKSKPGSSLKSIGIDLGEFNRGLQPIPYSPIDSSKTPLKEIKGNYGNIEEKRDKKPPESESLFLYHPITSLYPPLAKVCAENLTYEIFIELINKTDFVLRRLVESLEKKLGQDQKAYQIDRARIREKFTKK
jgi:four helix bundle protein